MPTSRREPRRPLDAGDLSPAQERVLYAMLRWRDAPRRTADERARGMLAREVTNSARLGNASPALRALERRGLVYNLDPRRWILSSKGKAVVWGLAPRQEQPEQGAK